MLEKFEIVLKDDKNKKIERKVFINIQDNEVQVFLSLSRPA